MITMYICFLAGGAVLPFLSTLLGFFGDGIDTDVNADVDVGIDIDAGTDLHVGTDIEAGAGLNVGTSMDSVFSIGLFPSSLMSLSALAIIFGAVGGIMTLSGKGKIITLVTAIVAGYLASVIVQTIVKSLRKVQKRSYGIDENELLLYDGMIVDTILPGQLGTVSFVTLKGVRVSYPARCADKGLKLETGKIVKALELKDGIFIVEPKNKYE